jgi:hypothetical protein
VARLNCGACILLGGLDAPKGDLGWNCCERRLFMKKSNFEKVSALRTEEYLAVRAAKADVRQALRVLARAGTDSPPLPGDELPARRRRPTTRRRA